ncbi:S9 family peptidase [bacterium]|nr:MAG: S9 family peptidase [bacterium]
MALMPTLLLSLVALQAGNAASPLTSEGYLAPPRPIFEAATAPWFNNVTPSGYSPDGKRYLVLERDGLTPLERLARPHANLAGVDIDLTASRARSHTTRSAKGLRVVEVESGKTIQIQTPKAARISDAEWSPDGTRLAFLAHFDDRTLLYEADPESGRASQATMTPLLPTMVTGFEWTKGGQIVCVLVPEDRTKRPESPLVASTPRIQNSDTKVNRIRTYASILQTPQEGDLLEYMTTGQIAIIALGKGGGVTRVGKPAMWESLSPSPDGKFVRATKIEKPFSYLVPASNFPEREVILDASGKELTELRKVPLRLGVEGEVPRAKEEDKRNIEWRPDGAGLSFLQLSPAKDGKRTDSVMLWKAPFGEKDAVSVYETEGRIASVRYSADTKTLFVTQTVGGRTQLSAIRPGTDAKPVVLTDSRAEAPTGVGGGRPGPRPGGPAGGPDVGTLQTRRDGTVRMSKDGKTVFFAGTKQPEDPMKAGPQPFIDSVGLDDAKRDRIWSGKADVYETAQPLDDDMARLVVTRQTPQDVPNSFLVDRTAKTDKKITDNRDYLPDITQAKRETLMVTRADGVKFRVRVTLPSVASYRPPAFFWFYPGEFASQDAYDRSLRTFNRNAFPTVSSSNKQILIRAGYAVVEPDVPIIGPEGRMNDGYVPQLRNSLSAIIDALDSRDLIDRNRLGIGGHSYGAFSTAHAMIATPFFKAGIAGDGNYLRPLTPFGFQSESRSLWEARELYLDMSPFLKAEQLTGALFMYHGLEDQNIGTAPINSERMFTALESLGKPSSLVMYPYEDHGQIARETVLDQWARFVAWLDTYLKAEGK